MTIYPKKAADVLDYRFDFAPKTNGTGGSDWLEAGDTIDTWTVTAATGLTVDSSTREDANTSILAWFSSGTKGRVYKASCKIVTVGGRTKTIDIYILVT